MSPLATFILNDASSITDAIRFDEINGKTFLLTGASGLVGHYIIAAISSASKQGITPKKLYLVVQNPVPEYFDDLIGTIPHEIITGDISDATFASSLPEADYIVHAAGYGQPGKFMSNQLKTIALNTVGTLGTISKLRPDGKYLFLSTSELYSGLSNSPFSEDQIGTTNTNHPRACYIEGKRCGEAIVNAARFGGTHASSARLSLAYGPGTRRDDVRVINSFIKKAITEGKIDMLDHGTALRTYMYITDAVKCMFNILFFGTKDIYNIGGISRTSIKNLAEDIGNILGVKVGLPDQAAQGVVGAPEDVSLDMNRVETEFGKLDYVPIHEGLGKTISWQKMLYLP